MCSVIINKGIKSTCKISLVISKSKSGKKMDYQSDRALDSSKQDAFKHTHYVEVLKDILKQSNTPLNIGLYGRWGVGKSSILHMLKEALSKKPLSRHFRYVEVDAWGFSAKSLQQDILVDLNNQLRAFSKNKMEDMLFNERTEAGRTIRQIPRKYWYAFLAAIAGIGIGIWPIVDSGMREFIVPLNLMGYVIILGTFVTIIRLIVNSSTTTVPRPISPFQFGEIYEKMVKRQKSKTLVVAIDNIDRCDDKVAVDLLGIIQTFMAKPGCVNILACDNEAIIKHLLNVNGELTDRECNEFLSKFFQVTIRIPPFIGENLDSYAQRLIDMRSVQFDPFVKQVLISGAVKNPRKINQFLNNITALYRLAEQKEKDGRLRRGSVTDHTDVLAKIVVLQHEWPEFYKVLEKEPRLLSDKNMNWKNNSEVLNNINKSADGLSDFLNATEVCFTNDFSPFLRLSQESYQADIPEIDQFELDVNANRLDSVRTAIGRLKAGKREPYVKKINALANEHAKDDNTLAVVNCTRVQIGILDMITDPAQRKMLLANLGRHLSETVVTYIEKYDYKKLFPATIEIEDVFSNKIFERLAEMSTAENKLDAQLTGMFMSNNKSIPQKILVQVDKNLEKLFETDDEGVVSLLQDEWSSQEWGSNNFKKPTRTLLKFYRSINLDDSPKDNERLALAGKIYGTVSSAERLRFILDIFSTAKKVAESGSMLPTQLFEVLDGIAEELDSRPYAQEFVRLLLQLIKIDVDQEHQKRTFEIVFKIIKKAPAAESAKTMSDLIGPLAEFLRVTAHGELKWFMEKASEHETHLLRSEKIIDAFWENFYSHGPNDKDIINYLVTKSPEDHEDKILSLLLPLASSGDEGQYSALLDALVDFGNSWPTLTAKKLRIQFIEASRDAPQPARIEMLENVAKSCESRETWMTLRQVASEMLLMTSGDDPGVLANAYRVLGAINARKILDPIGIDEAIDRADQLFETNNEVLRAHLDFVLNSTDYLNARQKRTVSDMFGRRIKIDAPKDAQLLALDYTQRLDRRILKRLTDDIVELAEKVQEDDIKNACREVLVSVKQDLRFFQKGKVERIFGRNVFE